MGKLRILVLPTALLLLLFNVQAGSVEHPEVIVSMAVFTGGLSQFMAGMWEYSRGSVFNATLFSLYGSFWMSYATIFIPAPGILAAYKDPLESSHAVGLYLITWTIVTAFFLFVVVRRNLALTVMLFTIFITLVILSISQYSLAGMPIQSPFAVLHSETSEQVAVDMDYHWAMYELHHKVNPKEVIVGCWIKPQHILCTDTKLLLARDCSSSSHPSAPHPAIHVFLDTGVEPGQPAGVKGYVSSLVGVFPKPENCVFVPVPVELRFRNSERSGVDLLTSTALSSSSTSSQPLSDLTILESSIQNVISMIDRVLTYIRTVLAGETKGDAAIGRYLMDTLGASTDDLEKGAFNGRLQDTLMISYLANLVRAQAEVSSRLALLTAC